MLNKMMTKLNFSFLDAFFEKMAHENFTTWHYAKEHRAELVIALLLKFGTIAIGIYAGYNHLAGYMESLSYSSRLTLAIIGILLLEIASAIAINKFFKYSLKWSEAKYKALSAFVVSMCIYGVSFYVSTTGMAEKQAQKADKTTEISRNFEAEKAVIVADIQKQVATIEANPTKTMPDDAGQWIIKQLSTKQQNKIDSLNQVKDAKILKLEGERTRHEAKNTTTVNTAYNKYYRFVAVIMIIQFFSNFFLMFSWKKIRQETKPEEFRNQKVSNINKNVVQGMENLIFSNYSLITNSILNTLRIADLNQPGNTPPALGTNAGKMIGFTKISDNTKADEQKAETQPTDTPKTESIPEATPNAQTHVSNAAQSPQAENTTHVNTHVHTHVSKYGSAICPQCGNKFEKTTHNKLFCSPICRISAKEAENGKDYTRYKLMQTRYDQKKK